MKGTLKKCIIAKYDKTIKEPPYLTIKINEIEVLEPKEDDLGSLFAKILKQACIDKGYIFKFYTLSREKNFDYEIVVY